MKAIGITAEFNPLHNGHRFLIDDVRAKHPSHAVVCVMSGNFVQHGGPAVLNKFKRAEIAILNGADLVLELPVAYAVNSAEFFAKGAVSIFKALGVIDTIAFGSETGVADYLCAFAAKKETEEFKESLKKMLSEGLSYNTAYSRALGTEELGPNDILGLEYIRQSLKLDSGFKFYTVKRSGMPHASESLEKSTFASSTAIRRALLSDDINNIYVNLPEDSGYDIPLMRQNYGTVVNKYYESVKYKILDSKSDAIAEILEVREGLENRFRTALRESSDLDQLILAIKSKRYTYSGISRMLCQLALGITKTDFNDIDQNAAPYARVLGFTKTGSQLLKEIKSNCPVITNVNNDNHLTDAQEKMLRMDIKSNDLYSYYAGANMYRSSDHVKSPFILITR